MKIRIHRFTFFHSFSPIVSLDFIVILDWPFCILNCSEKYILMKTSRGTFAVSLMTGNAVSSEEEFENVKSL
jgi:hypothetical protein